ncbi:MAG TPA: hypothetical protein VJK03_04060 [Candidatus Nanoarchaeia archaeon]|nr:hypothetical protein [Candidatus Nanoarchaeia archaeon]
MKGTHFLLVVAMLAALFAIGTATYLFVSFQEMRLNPTGYAIAGTSTNATVNITVNSNALINFTIATANFGAGSVNIGVSRANVSTNGTGTSTGGSWTAAQGDTNAPNFTGLLLENVGNINVTVQLNFSQTADTFLGGTAPNYSFSVVNNESASCNFSYSAVNSSGSLPNYNGSGSNAKYHQINATLTSYGIKICTPLDYQTASNSIRIDLLLEIPSNSRVGSLYSNITAFASSY